jgi:TM2 domain-containing membrane protein YozV
LSTHPQAADAPASASGSASRPGLAVVLSLLWPGLGQLYNRQIARGLLLIFGLPVLAKIGLGYAFLGAYEALGDLRYLGLLVAGLSILLLAAGIWIYATVDAYRVAQRHNVFHPPGSIDAI